MIKNKTLTGEIKLIMRKEFPPRYSYEKSYIKEKVFHGDGTASCRKIQDGKFSFWVSYKLKPELHEMEVWRKLQLDWGYTIENQVMEKPKKVVDMGPKLGYSECLRIYQMAELAGRQAYENKKPVPMIVQQHENPLDDNSKVEKSYFVGEGMCGFAWVTIRPANGSFAKFLKKYKGMTRDSYSGGITWWPHDVGQSIERKEAWAGAVSKVLSDKGIYACMGSRLD